MYTHAQCTCTIVRDRDLDAQIHTHTHMYRLAFRNDEGNDWGKALGVLKYFG